ncbi:hypothetical protein K6L44_17280 [Gluconacetobacter entanii]|uniref:hypothetical protein n=1 Tax=Gluconacetobacter entanii TaxID=108528 RepID=UPI001C933144|nr:hypothetical protein [Gluconacetobacter entanii]MBY4641700.1 hypothetical protein [Gluconacetobacter entanii]MCW4578891.1 hypothetical protein [Gluconacetobacter entanii]MCW4582290.1 hypothetical protein [Gluconacetobacter entanii]MCW4585673.1 hypothetical protein [Gluconacetobacter entanii]
MDPNTLLQDVLSLLPTQYAGDVAVIVSFLISTCALIARFWRPPDPASRWVVVWTIVTAVAQARKWNLPAYQPGKKAVMVSATVPRKAVEQLLDVPPGSTRPGRPPARASPPG